MIPKETVDRIFETAVIEEVIGQFVQLKKSGSSYKARSPFTDEKTPSFFVVPHKGIYKCFSSGKGGNVVNFLMEYERMTYPEALRWLADKYNIEIAEEKPSEEELERTSDRESLGIINAYAQEYFSDQMWNAEEGKAIALSYFRERGFREDIIKKFNLGYCPDKWDAFTKAALEKGYELKYLVKSGLSKEKNGSAYDFFRGRVMFPIINVSGKTIAFGGRTLKSGKGIAKYYNSPESEVYIKSKALYGIHLARTSIVKNDQCYLVEGYTDVIAMHQAGVENVVASAGTALTEDQIRLIRRFSKNICVLFDGDAAGIKASFRSIDLILSQGLNVKVVLFPDGEDPDSFAKNRGAEEVSSFLKNEAKDFVVFKTELLSEEAKNDPIKKGDMVRDIVESIAVIPDIIQRTIYLQECSRILEISEEVINNEVNKVLRRESRRASGGSYVPEPIPFRQPQPTKKDIVDIEHQERDLVRILMNYGLKTITVPVVTAENEEAEIEMTVAEYLVYEVVSDEIIFENPLYQQMIADYARHLEEEKFPEEKYFALHHEESICTLYADLISERYILSENWVARHKIYPETEEMKLLQAVQDTVRRLRLKKIQLMIRAINGQLKEENLDESKWEVLIQHKLQLDQAKAKISAFFGTTIVE